MGSEIIWTQNKRNVSSVNSPLNRFSPKKHAFFVEFPPNGFIPLVDASLFVLRNEERSWHFYFKFKFVSSIVKVFIRESILALNPRSADGYKSPTIPE